MREWRIWLIHRLGGVLPQAITSMPPYGISGNTEPIVEERTTGLYHPDEDDMKEYLNDKFEIARLSQRNPYSFLDWNKVMKHG